MLRVFEARRRPATPQTSELSVEEAPAPLAGEGGSDYSVVLSQDGYFAGAKLLLSDVRMARVLADEARYRAIERLFGVPRENAGLVTVIALGTMAAVTRAKLRQVFKLPDAPDAMIGGSLVREVMFGVGGPATRDMPLFPTLAVAVLIGRGFHPALRASWRAAKVAGHDARAEFDHRYGHLIRRNKEGS